MGTNELQMTDQHELTLSVILQEDRKHNDVTWTGKNKIR